MNKAFHANAKILKKEFRQGLRTPMEFKNLLIDLFVKTFHRLPRFLASYPSTRDVADDM